jgi:hypothetical protein
MKKTDSSGLSAGSGHDGPDGKYCPRRGGNEVSTMIPGKEYKSQSAKILRFLRNGGSLTALDALRLFGCARLAARIKDLRSVGHPIISAMIQTEGKRHAVYFLAPSMESDHD